MRDGETGGTEGWKVEVWKDERGRTREIKR